MTNDAEATSQTFSGWGCFNPNRELVWSSLAASRANSIAALAGPNWQLLWSELEPLGWLCLPMQASADPNGGRGPSAKANEPHWIVKRVGKYGPSEFTPRLHWRHATEALATAEAKRLAELCRGQRFVVYAATTSFQIEA